MPTPTRHDAITFLVFVGVGLLSALAVGGSVYLLANLFDVDASSIVDSALGVLVAVTGGGAAAARYHRKGSLK
jgi:hypothetical protein